MYIRHCKEGTDHAAQAEDLHYADAAPQVDELLVTDADESILWNKYFIAPFGRSQGGSVGAHLRPYSVGRTADPYGARHLCPYSVGRKADPYGARHIDQLTDEKYEEEEELRIPIPEGCIIVSGQTLMAHAGQLVELNSSKPLKKRICGSTVRWKGMNWSGPEHQCHFVLEEEIEQLPTGCYLNLADGQAAHGMPWQRSRRFFECSRDHGHRHAAVPHGSRGVPLSLISFNANARIGEASNLGPYTVGGGSASSGGGVPPVPHQSLSEQRAAWRNSLTSKMTAAEAVPEDFSVPVVCRDVNLQHQSDVRWYFAPDVAGVLQDELCGETWRESDLTAYIRKIFDDGEGVLDPAKLVIGESDFGAYDHECGWVARDDLPMDPRLLPAPISSVAERAARDRAERDDIVAELLQEMGCSSRIERHATSFANLATNAAARIFPPEIVEEETGKELDLSIQAAVTARAQQLTVGPAVERSRRPPS